jgi:hypothetical protein
MPIAPIDILGIALMLEFDCELASLFVTTLGAVFRSAGARCASAALEAAAACIGRHGHTFADAHAGRAELSAITGTATAAATNTAATLSTRIALSAAPHPECTWNRARRRRMSSM